MKSGRWSVLLLLSALLPPWVAAAQAPVILVQGSVSQYRQALSGVRRGLPNAREVNPTSGELAAELAGAPVIVAVGQQALGVARKAAPETPVVFCMVFGATTEDSKVVTGVPLEADAAAVLQQIKALSPATRKVGVILNRATGAALEKEAQAAAKKLGLELVTAAVASPAEVESASRGLVEKVQAVWLPADPRLFNREVLNFLLGLTSERKVPIYGFLDSFTEAGALASVSPDYEDIGLRAGRLAQEIAQRPASSRVPVPPRTYSPGKLTINARTAKALGIALSDGATAGAKQIFR